MRGGYTAWIEEMPGVISEGKTRKAAEKNIRDALELMLETNRNMSLKEPCALGTGFFTASSISDAPGRHGKTKFSTQTI